MSENAVTTPGLPPDYRQVFRVRGNEVDYHNRATAAALAGWMMEAAGVHADQLGISMNRLHAGGRAWALSRMVLECGPLPESEGQAVLRTWPTRLERLQFRRDFQLFDCSGRLLARAATFWVIMDLAERKLLRMPEPFHSLLDGEPELAMPVEKCRLSRLRLPGAAPCGHGAGSLEQPVAAEDLASAHLAGEARILVRRADLDTNGHVNSVRYLDWLMEAVPQSVWEGCRLRRLEVLYRAEMRGGSALSRCIALLPSSSETAFGSHSFAAAIHAEENGGERELLRAFMRWEPVGGDEPGPFSPDGELS